MIAPLCASPAPKGAGAQAMPLHYLYKKNYYDLKKFLMPLWGVPSGR